MRNFFDMFQQLNILSYSLEGTHFERKYENWRWKNYIKLKINRQEKFIDNEMKSHKIFDNIK